MCNGCNLLLPWHSYYLALRLLISQSNCCFCEVNCKPLSLVYIPLIPFVYKHIVLTSLSQCMESVEDGLWFKGKGEQETKYERECDCVCLCQVSSLWCLWFGSLRVTPNRLHFWLIHTLLPQLQDVLL